MVIGYELLVSESNHWVASQLACQMMMLEGRGKMEEGRGKTFLLHRS